MHAIIVIVSMLGATITQAGFGEQYTFLFDHPIHETWYKKALDACMQSWGDLRTVVDAQEDSAIPGADTTRDLIIIDAAVGRLHFADFCLKNLCARPIELADDDIWYLWRIMQECDSVCAKLEQNLCYKDRAECVRTAAQQVRDRLAKYTYAVDEAFFYKATSIPQPNS